nr:intracellular coagulation inhibitor 1-like [Parasteatoda tepidariorum]
MHLTSEFPYVAYDDLQVLELPYKGDNISMIVLLPQDNGGLTDLEHTITSKEILAIRNEMSKSKVKVTFPKFKVEYKRTMNKDFSALGATDMFNPDLADFTAITPNDGICVSDIIHKAVVEVNEEGSEAAAATSIGVRATAAISDPQPTPLFIADHPFMFAIMDNRNNMMLFLGRVNEL